MEREGGEGTVCRICQPSSIEIVQYNARIKNAMRCNFECIHLLAPATFLITHPYYYFILFLLLLLLQFLFWFCFYFGSHAQILKYRSIWRAVLVPLVINILAATAQAVSNTPTRTLAHRHT